MKIEMAESFKPFDCSSQAMEWRSNIGKKKLSGKVVRAQLYGLPLVGAEARD